MPTPETPREPLLVRGVCHRCKAEITGVQVDRRITSFDLTCFCGTTLHVKAPDDPNMPKMWQGILR